jgi:hypothetical protein
MNTSRLCPALFPEIEDDDARSSLSVSVVEGPAVNLWSMATEMHGDTKTELTLQLQPDNAVVIGRQEGGEIEYLDPRYQPTQMLPNSSRRVVASKHSEKDNYVSRGHITLKGALHGVLLVNGVPRRGGGIRPPRNGTVMLEPDHRSMEEGEEFMIEREAAAKIRLPNGTVILLRAA